MNFDCRRNRGPKLFRFSLSRLAAVGQPAPKFGHFCGKLLAVSAQYSATEPRPWASVEYRAVGCGHECPPHKTKDREEADGTTRPFPHGRGS